MATTYVRSGSLVLTALLAITKSVELTGTDLLKYTKTLAFTDVGGTEPDFYTGTIATITAAAGDWLLAHATDPFQGMGDAGWAGPGAPRAGTDKLKLLLIENLDTANNIVIARGAAAGLPLLDAASDAFTLRPGGIFLFYDKAGVGGTTITTATNDKLTISVSAGAPTARVLALFGP